MLEAGASPEDIYSSFETEHIPDGDNVGLVVPEGVVVFDCDDAGATERLLAMYPEAPAQLTRSGGLHLWFKLKPNEKLSNTQSIEFEGASGDIRSHGSQVVVAPSIGIGGGAYRWLRRLPNSPDELPMRPDHLVKGVSKGSKVGEVVDRDHGSRPDSCANKPSKTLLKPLENYRDGQLYHKLAAGEPFGRFENRNNDMITAIGAVLGFYNTVNPQKVWEILSYSIAADKTEGAPTLSLLWDRSCALADRQAAQTVQLAEIKAGLEFERLEKTHETAEALEVSVEELQRRLVLYLRGENYILNEETLFYLGPYSGGALVERLERLSSSLITYKDLRKPNGETKKAADIIASYGTPIGGIEYRCGAQGATYDAGGGVLIQSVWDLRKDLEPAFDKQVHRWLTLLGGDRVDKLLDWIATATMLHSPTCALYLRGRKESGKGMFASGIARLWGQPYTRYGHATSRFNDALLRSPLILLDEGLSQSESSAVFREFIGASEYTVEKKFQSPVTLVGCPRLIIASNNDDALRIRDDIGADDLEAITDRIGWVEVSDESSEYLRALGGRTKGTKDWVDGDRIARHALWLVQDREVCPGNRFLVQGWDHPKIQGMPRRLKGTGEVLSAIAHYLQDTIGGDHRELRQDRIVCDRGNLYVNISGLSEYWGAAESRIGRPLSEAAMGRALSMVSEAKPTQVRINNQRIRMRKVKLPMVLAHIEETGIGDSEFIRCSIQEARHEGAGEE